MMIECTIRRAKGSNVRLGHNVYQFGPAPDGHPHVAEVEDAAHAAHLLGLRPLIYREFNVAAFVAPKPPAREPIKYGEFFGTMHPELVVVRLKEAARGLGEVIAATAAMAELDAATWNAFSPTTRYEMVEAYITHQRQTEAREAAREVPPTPPRADAESPERGGVEIVPDGMERPMNVAEARAEVDVNPDRTPADVDGGTPSKHPRDMSERQLKAHAVRFGISQDMPIEDIRATLSVLPVFAA